MAKARHAWVGGKTGREGIYVHWYDRQGKRHNKKFPNKSMARTFASRKTAELNDEYHSPNAAPATMTWKDMLEEYRQWMVFKGRKPSSIERRFLSLTTFEETMHIARPSQITQALLIDYIIKFRKRKTRYGRLPSEATIYGEIANLRAFLNWACHKNRRYLAGPFDLEQDPAPAQWRKPVALRDAQVEKLFEIFNDDKVVKYPDAWRVRILLAAGCGLRRGDIEKLTPEDFDPETKSVRIREKKTSKFTLRPVHEAAWQYIWPYVSALPGKANRLFPDTYTSKKWKRICKAIGAPSPGFRFHDLRITFTSALAIKDVPTGVAQKLLNHSTSKLTNDVYTDFDPTLRTAIDRLPMDSWVKKIQPPQAGDSAETRTSD